ncbi:MAG TPA: DUF2249 domain-containing protein [Firmicutes bacterium]|nr:DUF2249 domain-containing protein [Bacillota bacterium]
MKTIDVRDMAPRERHPLIFKELAELKMGEALEIVNDHDPKPLLYQLAAEYKDMYGWEYKEAGPDDWRVVLKRLD